MDVADLEIGEGAGPGEAVGGSMAPPPLSNADFQRVQKIMFDLAGISIRPGKEVLVRSRLASRVREAQVPGFSQYFDFVMSPQGARELQLMIDLLTTNETYFFRESQHFDFLKAEVLPAMASRSEPMRVWSAGCSTGEEPYTLAMVIAEAYGGEPGRKARILATDLSRRVLAKAVAGSYPESACSGVPPQLLRKYFQRVDGARSVEWQANNTLKRMILFGRLNLMGPWPMKQPLDLILCRNVMIYFDGPTRERLVSRYVSALRPGGHLIVGRSESLTRSDDRLVPVMPSVYQRGSKV